MVLACVVAVSHHRFVNVLKEEHRDLKQGPPPNLVEKRCLTQGNRWTEEAKSFPLFSLGKCTLKSETGQGTECSGYY